MTKTKNMENVIIITGSSDERKSEFTRIFQEVFGRSCLLIDGKHPIYTSVPLTWIHILEYKQCARLVIDDLFLLSRDETLWESILCILEYRSEKWKFVLLTGTAEQFKNNGNEEIESLIADARVLVIDEKTDLVEMIAGLYMSEHPIDAARGMRMYQLDLQGNGFTESGVELELEPEEWNVLLQETDFLKLLETGLLQCLAADPGGNDLLSALLPLWEGKQFLKKFIKCGRLSNSAMDKLNTVMETWIDTGKIYLGIDLYSIE